MEDPQWSPAEPKKSPLPNVGGVMALMGLFTASLLRGGAYFMDGGQLNMLERIMLILSDVFVLVLLAGLVMVVIGLMRDQRSGA